MNLTTEVLASYLGGPAPVMLAAKPFNGWLFEKTVENDLEEPLIDYVFPDYGIDIVCNGKNEVASIFLYFDEARFFKAELFDIPIFSTRQQVVKLWGLPEKKGGAISDPILGQYGAWDRFARHGYKVHVQYGLGTDRIVKITLMQDEVAP